MASPAAAFAAAAAAARWGLCLSNWIEPWATKASWICATTEPNQTQKKGMPVWCIKYLFIQEVQVPFIDIGHKTDLKKKYSNFSEILNDKGQLQQLEK